jgi:hypothetical protein
MFDFHSHQKLQKSEDNRRNEACVIKVSERWPRRIILHVPLALDHAQKYEIAGAMRLNATPLSHLLIVRGKTRKQAKQVIY